MTSPNGHTVPIDNQLERMFVAALIADPSRHDHVQVSLTDLIDPQAHHAFKAFANVRARGGPVTSGAVRAELAATGIEAAVSGLRADPDRGWFDEFVEQPIPVDAPVAGWAYAIVEMAVNRESAVNAYDANERDIDAPALREVEDEPIRYVTPYVRPEVILSTEQSSTVDSAERALLKMGGVYVRAMQLVHVVRDHGSADWLKRPLGTPVIVPMDRDHLLDLLCRAVTWVTVRKGVPCRTTPPAWISARLLARGEWSLPQLEAISDAPVFRADGTIHEVPGYDPQTRAIFDPCGVEFPPVPVAPTHAMATHALADLLEPFAEFPFVASCDRAATAALILSVIGRTAITGCVPMFASQAPTPGSGKGLLVDAVAMICTGRKAPLMAPTDDDDETRKRLLAIAIESPAMVVIDNVEGSLGSPSLAMALTAGEIKERRLGGTEMVTASLRPVWCYTGNNVQLKGDLGRRVVPIDLDPKVEHPEDRKFQRGDLLGYISQHRARLVVAALTVLRAYVVAGRPDHGLPVKGSFEAWDRLVRGAVIWAGGVDPLAGVQRIREQSDDDLDRMRFLLTAWHGSFGSMPSTISDAIRHSELSADLKDALSSYCRSGRPEARPLGNAFKKLCGRPVNGLVLRRSTIVVDKTLKWIVEKQ